MISKMTERVNKVLINLESNEWNEYGGRPGVFVYGGGQEGIDIDWRMFGNKRRSEFIIERCQQLPDVSVVDKSYLFGPNKSVIFALFTQSEKEALEAPPLILRILRSVYKLDVRLGSKIVVP